MPSEPNSPMPEKESLHGAAERGDIKQLHILLEGDPKILDLIDDGEPFAHTSLHVAAQHGKAIFAVEVATFKPSFTRKLNPNGLSPLHVALISQQWKTARALTALDSELIRVKGSRGKTPLHVAAEIAPPQLLAELLYVCPLSVEDVTSRWETAVHRTVKKKNFENFEVLYRWLVIAHKECILDWKDFKGNTALHSAAAKRWKEVVEILVKHVPRKTVNFKGDTALKVFKDQQQPHGELPDDKKIGLLLTNCSMVNLVRESHNQFKYMIGHNLQKALSRYKIERWLRFVGFVQLNPEDESSQKSRDVALLIATLIATATYQAVLTPPGGYWQDDSPSNVSSSDSHKAGELIMSGRTLFGFMATNSLAFCFSTAVIVLNVVRLKQATLLMSATYILIFNYMATIYLTTFVGRNEDWRSYSPFNPKNWRLYPECILPSILLAISLVYAALGSYVAFINYFMNLMDFSTQRSIHALVGADDYDDDDDDDYDDDKPHRNIP